MQARKKVAKMKVDKVIHEEQTAASVKIQANFRGRRDRKRVKNIKKEIKKEKD